MRDALVGGVVMKGKRRAKKAGGERDGTYIGS